MSNGVFGGLSSIPSDAMLTERQIEEQIFGRKTVKDELERHDRLLGLQQSVKRPKGKYCNSVLALNNDEDRQFLNDLMNNREKYQVVSTNSTWTPQGDYRMFVVYFEKEETPVKS